MRRTYMKPVIDMMDFSTEKCLLQASFTEVTTEGLGNDPVEQIIFGQGPGGIPLAVTPTEAW